MANLKETFNNLSYDLITNTFSSISQKLGYKENKSVYDTESGEMIDFDMPGVVVDAIVGPFTVTRNEITDFQVGDLRAIVATKSLNEEQIKVFLQSDTFMIGEDVYTVINKVLDASESVYILQLRKA